MLLKTFIFILVITLSGAQLQNCNVEASSLVGQRSETANTEQADMIKSNMKSSMYLHNITACTDTG